MAFTDSRSVVHLRLDKGRVQQDRFKPPDGDDREVQFWKRLVVSGKAVDSQGEHGFETILDFRARLLTVRLRAAGVDASVVARGLVHELASYTMAALGSQFVPRPVEEAHVSVWIVKDPDHVAGLLHRLAEAGAFEARERPAKPGPLADILRQIVEDVEANVKAMEEWRDGSQQSWQILGQFTTAAWDANRERFLELVDDHDLKRDVARFFHLVRRYAEAVEVAMPYAGPHRPTVPLTGELQMARAYLTYEHQHTRALGRRIAEGIRATLV